MKRKPTYPKVVWMPVSVTPEETQERLDAIFGILFREVEKRRLEKIKNSNELDSNTKGKGLS